MSGASRTADDDVAYPTVHNGGPSAVRVQIVVHRDALVVESIRLEPGESYSVHDADDGPMEVHTADGTATTLAGSAPFVVIREGRVLVAPR